MNIGFIKKNIDNKIFNYFSAKIGIIFSFNFFDNVQFLQLQTLLNNYE